MYLNIFPSFALQGAGLERQRHLQAISGLDEEAGRLAQELLVLDLKLKKAREEKELIEKDLAITRVQRDQAYEQYKKSLEVKKQSLKKIGLWLNFQYRFGYWSLLDVILGSETLADLVHRSMMAAIILGRQAEDFRTAAKACAASIEREKALAESENRLIRQNRSLADQIDEIQDLSDRRREFLSEIKTRSRELALEVAALERKYLDSLNLVNFLTESLAKYPWQEVKPDRVTVGPGGLVAELSEATLNRSIQASGLKELADLSVGLKPGLFVLTGRDQNSNTAFSLGGALVLSGQSAEVRFEPRTLSLDGVPVTEEVTREIAASLAIYLPIPGNTGFKPSRIEIRDQIMDITLVF